jgi:hypothetical protein
MRVVVLDKLAMGVEDTRMVPNANNITLTQWTPVRVPMPDAISTNESRKTNSVLVHKAAYEGVGTLGQTPRR